MKYPLQKKNWTSTEILASELLNRFPGAPKSLDLLLVFGVKIRYKVVQEKGKEPFKKEKDLFVDFKFEVIYLPMLIFQDNFD